MALPTPVEIDEQRYTIYKAKDGLYHARRPNGEDMKNGMHQPIRNKTMAGMADYLQYLSIPFRVEV